MGEPAPWPPPPPTGAPILLALLSLVGSGAPGDGGPIYFQRDLPSGEHQREGYSPVPLQPLALVLRDAAQQRPKAELAQDVSPFTRPPSARRLERSWSGHRILKPATLPAKIRGFCRNHRAQDFERLFRRREQKKISERQPLSRHRRAYPWPGRLPSLRKSLGGKRDLVTLTPAHATVAPSLLVVKKDIPEPSRPGGEGHLTTPPQPGHQASFPALSTEDGTAHATGCLCPSRDLQKAQGQLGKDVKGPQRVGPRVPTPRTEEAAWAASALAFLLAVLTLSVLYTRLHRKCRRGRSLYWATAAEEGHDTVAAILKRRLLSVQGRRKKWPRRIQQRPLLSATSSDSSE